LEELDIGTVYVGSSDDPVIEGATDARGLSLYDTFSILKQTVGFVGRSSGNQSLLAFLPDIPLFEVEVPAPASMITCKGHNNTFSVSWDNFPDFVVQYFRDRCAISHV
jgi:hypothetical protein